MIEDILGYQARADPRGAAIVTPFETIGFAELDARAEQVAGALAAEPALAHARRVGVAIDNPVRHWLALHALLRLGRPSVSLPKAGQANAEVALRAAAPDLVLRDEAAGDGSVPALVLDDGWVEAVLSRPARAFVRGAFGPADIVRVVLSSGTTGRPKRISLSRARLEVSASQYLTTGGGSLRTFTTMGPQTVGGFLTPFVTWGRGGAMVFPAAGFDWASLLVTLQPDMLVMAPSDISELLRKLPPDFVPPEPVAIGTGGSALPHGVGVEARRRLGGRMSLMYGSTEGGTASRMRLSDAPLPPGAVGYLDPRGVEVQIVGSDGRVAPPGALGEVRIRGPQVVDGYDDEDDRGVFRDGWFHPGDMGRLTPEGLLLVEGRTAEFINVGGVKYAPLAIEEVLRACAGVRDVAAFAVTGPDGTVTAHVALALDAAFDADAANAAIRSHFPRMALHVMTLKAIPRNAMGKAEHQTLRRMAAAQRAN